MMPKEHLNTAFSDITTYLRHHARTMTFWTIGGAAYQALKPNAAAWREEGILSETHFYLTIIF